MKTEDLNLPHCVSDPWMGGTRHRFSFAGHETWVVEPADPAPGNLWFALPEWPSAFPNRNGVKELLSLGYYMVHVKLFGLFANPEAVEVMHDFYLWMRKRNFAEKGALIGMSLGGLYSFRFAAAYPECVACIYADAPVCDLAFGIPARRCVEDIMKAYQIKSEAEMKDHPLSPVNNFLPMVRAGIPILMIVGLDDNVVDHASNGSLLAERYSAAGGSVKVIGRPSWGHHPHGLDDTAPIVSFVIRNCR